MRYKLYPEPFLEQYAITPPNNGVVISRKIMLSLNTSLIKNLANESLNITSFEIIDGIELAPVRKLDKDIVWAVKVHDIITLMFTSEI